ncbi:hypothetical protein [Bradyrhizobium sp.]|uniref:hypothetical protein n=1 Tax=Bradyrhizobium sp. TaxID=376 RepID=UPI003C17A925
MKFENIIAGMERYLPQSLVANLQLLESVDGERLEGEKDMLRISSVKAFVVSNIIQFVLFSAIAVALAFSMVALRIPIPLPAKGVMPLGGATILMVCLSAIPSSLIAGFVAGRIAEYRPVLHGVLSGTAWLIQDLYAALHTAVLGGPSRAHFPISLSLTLTFAVLLCGALGGYGAANVAGSANRYNVAPVPRNRLVQRGLVPKLLLSLAVTTCVCAIILFSPTIFCHGEGAGGNCGEAYMLSIPAAMLALPIVFAGAVFLI